MAYTVIPSPGFSGGMNLKDKTDAVEEAQAIDLLNVTFTTTGAIRQRDGVAKFTSSALTNAVDSLLPFYKTDGTTHLVAGCGTRVEVLDATGAVVSSGSLTGMTAGLTWDFARFGSPNNERVYAGNGTNTIQRWDESAHWTAPANMPKAGALCVQPNDNRLVATRFNTTSGGPSAATSSPSHVWFSNVGDPETWGANDFVQLTPSDGEKIQGVCTWREFVFVFKETRFFVFWGNSTDSAANAIFNYRTVDAGVGLASPRALAVAPEGVYFMDRAGVYLTTGQEPTLVSDLVSPVWFGSASSFYGGGVLEFGQIANCAMGFYRDQIYLGFTPTGGTTNSKTLVYDIRNQWWTLYDFPASCFTTFRVSNVPELLFGYASGTKDVARHNTTYTNDAGSAISSYWRSGWFDYGWITRYGRAYDSPAPKIIRESKMWGSGKFFYSLSPDFQQGTGKQQLMDFSDPTSTHWNTGNWNNQHWGSAHSLRPAIYRTAVQGTVHSIYISNNTLDQRWTAERLEHHVRTVRRGSTLEPVT